MTRTTLLRVGTTAIVVAAAVLVGAWLWNYYLQAPWTRDGHVLADVVGVTPDVSGLVAVVEVHDNQRVKAGDTLIEIDHQRFQLAVWQAEAVVASRLATLDEAKREADRYAALPNIAVSVEKQQQTAATLQEASASYQQARADLEVADLNLVRSTVKASVNGIVSNFSLRPGDYVTAGKAIFALVDTDTIHVDGYFEETKLAQIRPGDPATVRLLGSSAVLTGRVDSIAGGIDNREQNPSENLLANITPTFSWVRLAQRVPVRVKLDQIPPDLLPGRTATVIIHPDSSPAPPPPAPPSAPPVAAPASPPAP